MSLPHVKWSYVCEENVAVIEMCVRTSAHCSSSSSSGSTQHCLRPGRPAVTFNLHYHESRLPASWARTPPSPSVIKAQVPLADDGLPHLFHLKKRARGYVCVCVSLACVGMYVCKLACICLWRMADKTAVVKIQVHVFQSGKNLSVSLQYLYVIRSNMIGTNRLSNGIY